ncbi:hypothetical protein [Micromonospora carbonacea]|uniref:hypothetical protein n=1 Tax=Micromonospora carbonacea TaxID=47853 RepID=UPI003720B7CC
MTGQPREALRVMEQALELNRRIRRTAGVAVNHNNLGLPPAGHRADREAARRAPDGHLARLAAPGGPGATLRVASGATDGDRP